jgi:hypothetical protein
VSSADEFVQLYRSLGGGWQNYQQVPAIRQPQPAVLAAFRRLVTSGRPAPGAAADAGATAPPATEP